MYERSVQECVNGGEDAVPISQQFKTPSLVPQSIGTSGTCERRYIYSGFSVLLIPICVNSLSCFQVLDDPTEDNLHMGMYLAVGVWREMPVWYCSNTVVDGVFTVLDKNVFCLTLL